jgi:hypothetical protein
MEQRRGGLRGAAAEQLKAAAKPGEFATAACTLRQQNHFHENNPARDGSSRNHGHSIGLP